MAQRVMSNPELSVVSSIDDTMAAATPPAAPREMPRQVLERPRPAHRRVPPIWDIGRLFARNA